MIFNTYSLIAIGALDVFVEIRLENQQGGDMAWTKLNSINTR